MDRITFLSVLRGWFSRKLVIIVNIEFGAEGIRMLLRVWFKEQSATFGPSILEEVGLSKLCTEHRYYVEATKLHPKLDYRNHRYSSMLGVLTYSSYSAVFSSQHVSARTVLTEKSVNTTSIFLQVFLWVIRTEILICLSTGVVCCHH